MAQSLTAPNEHIYTYVKGNPISKIDPLGLIDLDIPGATSQNLIHGNPGPEATIPGSRSAACAHWCK